jgi:hypothetical protein
MASLPRRVGAPLVLALATLLPGAVAGAATAPSPPDQPTASTVLDNPFLPENTAANISDCISALPRPECGSKERGGWRQGVLFGVVIAGLAGIGLRIGLGVRRRDREGRG